ncbi:MAG: GNAT family N-acetyltransferase [Hominenteromicrobium sp.]
MTIRAVQKRDLPLCLAVIRESFATVAAEFGLTEHNCPTHTSFMKLGQLQEHFEQGWKMVGLWEGARLIGFYALSDEGAGRFELHNLAVLPDDRRLGCGRQLLDDAKSRVTALGGEKITIGIIEESTVLKNWYMRGGFVPTGTRRFDHLPFTVGFLEWHTSA